MLFCNEIFFTISTSINEPLFEHFPDIRCLKVYAQLFTQLVNIAQLISVQEVVVSLITAIRFLVPGVVLWKSELWPIVIYNKMHH